MKWPRATLQQIVAKCFFILLYFFYNLKNEFYENKDVSEAVRKQTWQYYGRFIGIFERLLVHPECARTMPVQHHQNHCGFIGTLENTRSELQRGVRFYTSIYGVLRIGQMGARPSHEI